MKKAWMIFCCLVTVSFGAVAQSEEDAPTVYVIDSVQTTSAALEKISPDQLASITVAKGQKAVDKYGPQAANGVVYIETKPFARRRINKLFSEASPAYDQLLKRYGNDSSFCYIINNKPVSPVGEARLMTLDKKTFISLEILTPRQLQKKFQINGKKAGVLIISTEE
ncbi:MAG TPA: hypothetical protein VM802_31260 [Chitinophaga sp.]|uniref:hypothetical protein n=1 Tax=Chitinophaga sp. TaxID=1869181 RepID=UPI002BE2A0D1|nr:hypothetical protein [Chitinophaga sp.]HVI49386.1 hypothetical protein [Chitinophaga sp.]